MRNPNLTPMDTQSFKMLAAQEGPDSPFTPETPDTCETANDDAVGQGLERPLFRSKASSRIKSKRKGSPKRRGKTVPVKALGSRHHLFWRENVSMEFHFFADSTSTNAFFMVPWIEARAERFPPLFLNLATIEARLAVASRSEAAKQGRTSATSEAFMEKRRADRQSRNKRPLLEKKHNTLNKLNVNTLPTVVAPAHSPLATLTPAKLDAIWGQIQPRLRLIVDSTDPEKNPRKKRVDGICLSSSSSSPRCVAGHDSIRALGAAPPASVAAGGKGKRLSATFPGAVPRSSFEVSPPRGGAVAVGGVGAVGRGRRVDYDIPLTFGQPGGARMGKKGFDALLRTASQDLVAVRNSRVLVEKQRMMMKLAVGAFSTSRSQRRRVGGAAGAATGVQRFLNGMRKITIKR